jgi:hypothetical protein
MRRTSVVVDPELEAVLKALGARSVPSGASGRP